MSLSSTTLPKPKNWEDFERQTRELFAFVLNDPTTQRNGRSGQEQHCVDVYGYRRPDWLVGVQCKKKFDDEVTDKELRTEVEKAKQFEPKISEFVLITTAPRDQKVQESARRMTEELRQTDHPILVSVWGWEDVEEHAAKHERAWKAFDPTWNPFVERGLEKVILEVQEIKTSLDTLTKGTRPLSSAPTDITLDKSDENTLRHGQITAFQRLIDNGDVHAALTQLIKLKTDEWANASRSERYRILVCTASAKLRLGEQNEAGTLLLEAYGECPEHKNAQKNRAKGFLLKNDHKEATKLAREMLANSDSDADAAGILIQALIADATCDDPLSDVPKALHEAEEVFVARVYFLRCRSNPDWVILAKTAAKKYPGSRLLRLFSAESVLDELVHTDRDAIAGGFLQNIRSDELNDAVEALYSEAREAIDKGYSPLPSIANNAALALRLSDDLTRAKEVLDAAIKRYPDDENLRLQRAIISCSENDPTGALAVLPNKPSDLEAIAVLAHALAATGKPDDALSLIDDTDEDKLPEHVKTGFLAVRARAYMARGEKQLAIDTIAQRIALQPQSLTLRALQIRTLRTAGNEDDALKAL